ncbi:MAG: hypothetical protein REI78_12835 [Pedobacter sp.]|nr:hypothetical protein [Pedobacter sp.]
MIRFLSAVLLCIPILAFCGKEYPSGACYFKENPAGKHDGTDGNWLRSDRKHQTAVWKIANEVNLQSNNGFCAYQTIWERADFYKWYGHRCDSLGCKIRWPKLAAKVTFRMGLLMGSIPTLTGNSNKEIKDFISTGSELVLRDSWQTLREIRLHKPMGAMEARTWDASMLLSEQKLIHPAYLQLSDRSIRKLEKLLRKETLATQYLSGIAFEGSLRTIDDVYGYGLKMMGY